MGGSARVLTPRPARGLKAGATCPLTHPASHHGGPRPPKALLPLGSGGEGPCERCDGAWKSQGLPRLSQLQAPMGRCFGLQLE